MSGEEQKSRRPPGESLAVAAYAERDNLGVVIIR